MKMEINIKITNDKGDEIITPVTVDTEVPKLAPKEKYHTASFDTLALKLATNITSYRVCDELFNHVIWQGDEEKIKYRSLRGIDDIGTVEQKESGRTKYPEPKEERHYVKNTVIHIQQALNKYILVGLGIKRMMLIMIAFLLENEELRNKHLIFFTDGASDIRKAIKDMFGWRSHQILLDWYHLRKKCKQRLSMAMKGKDFRNEAVKDVLSILWAGNLEDAVKYLRSIDDKKIRNKAEIERLIGYFDKNWSYIPCYALRQKLGLRVSSNRGEKANDLVVAKRQKHNGMSWSKYGSSGLANVSSIFLNNESENWIIHRKLNFNFNADNSKIAA